MIGSAEACDLRVDSAEPAHARIDRELVGGAERAVIEASAACRVGKVPLDVGARRLIVAGVVIEIAGEELRVDEEQPSDLTTRELALEAVGQELRARALVVEGPALGAAVAIGDGAATVGRSSACALDVGDDDGVSRLHLEIVRRGNDFLVRDLGSATGTFMGRARLERHRAVSWPADRLVRVGRSVLALEVPWWLRSVPASPPVDRASPEPAAEHAAEVPGGPPAHGPDGLMTRPLAPLAPIEEVVDDVAGARPRSATSIQTYLLAGLLLLVLLAAALALVALVFV